MYRFSVLTAEQPASEIKQVGSLVSEFLTTMPFAQPYAFEFWRNKLHIAKIFQARLDHAPLGFIHLHCLRTQQFVQDEDDERLHTIKLRTETLKGGSAKLRRQADFDFLFRRHGAISIEGSMPRSRDHAARAIRRSSESSPSANAIPMNTP